MTFDEVEAYLSRLAEALPEPLFRELNGGIVLLPDTVMPAHDRYGQLYTLGTYHHQPHGLGRYISIHYGSFVAVHGMDSRRRQREALRRVLLHELTHHMENLAGLRDLEEKDRGQLERYLAQFDDED